MALNLSDGGEHQAVVHDRLRVQLVLRLGLAAGIGLLSLGLLAALVGGPTDASPVSLTELRHLTPLTPERVCGLGVLVLALTPVVRVLALIVLWAEERDWKYVAVACTVAVVLGLAIRLGGG